MKILIAHRDECFRNSLAFILESRNFKVEQADAGWKAILKLLELKNAGQPVDLMVLDIDILSPGIEPLFAELIYYKLALPTLVVVGLFDEKDFDQFGDKLPIEYLRLPFTEDQILNRISLLRRKTNNVSRQSPEKAD